MLIPMYSTFFVKTGCFVNTGSLSQAQMVTQAFKRDLPLKAHPKRGILVGSVQINLLFTAKEAKMNSIFSLMSAISKW